MSIVLYISSLTWDSDSLCAKGQKCKREQCGEGGRNKTVCGVSEREEKESVMRREQSPTCITEVACKYDEANTQMQGGGGQEREERENEGSGDRGGRADMIKH